MINSANSISVSQSKHTEKENVSHTRNMTTTPHEGPCPVWRLRNATPDNAPPSAFVYLATQAITYDKCAEHLEYALQKHHSVVVTQKEKDDMKTTKHGTCYWLLLQAAIKHERPVEALFSATNEGKRLCNRIPHYNLRRMGTNHAQHGMAWGTTDT